MKRFTTYLLAMILIGLVAGCDGSGDKNAGDNGGATAAGADFAFYSGARWIPGDGSPAIEEATVIVENGKLKSIGKKGEFFAPKNSLQVDMAGRTVMPVLVNVHGHPGLNNGASFGPENYSRESVISDLNRYGYYGVGTIVALGSDAGDTAIQIRNEQKDGKLGGARLMTAGRGITAKGGFPTNLLKDLPIQVGTEAEARKAVDDNAALGVDLIKIWVDDAGGSMPKLKHELAAAAIDQAHKKNLKAVAHVFYLADAKDLVKAGIDGIVHSIRDTVVDDGFVAEMKAKNVFYAPTLTAHESKFIYADKPQWLFDQTLREVYPAQLSGYLLDDTVVNNIKRDPNTAKAKEQYAIAQKNLKKLADGGVTIVLGTDSGTARTLPGFFEQRELLLMGEAGMEAMDIIKAATTNSADALGLKDQGALVVGKNADLIVLSANPLEKIANSKEIFTIYKGGHEIDRLDMKSKIKIEIPKVSQAEKNAEQNAQIEDAHKAADKNLKHYGQFPAGNSAMISPWSVPVPKYAKATSKIGPPHVVTVSYKASAAELKQFYTEALAAGGWKPAGDCFEKTSAIAKKTANLCVATGSGTATITITEK